MSEAIYRALADARALFSSFSARVELPRKLWHCLTITLAAWLAYLIDDYLIRVILTIIALMIGIGFEWLRTRVAIPLIAALHRKKEIEGQRTTVVDFLAALCIGAVFFEQQVLVAALLITAWCDPAAAFVGQIHPKPTKWPGSKKSVEGTLVCAAVAIGIALFMIPIVVPMGAIVVVGIGSALAELLSYQHLIMKGRFKGCLTPADNFWIVVTTCILIAIVCSMYTYKGPII